MNIHKEISAIAFYDEKGNILLQGREGIAKFGEEWTFFGGGVQEGESKEDAIIREIREELDYDLKEHEHIITKTFQTTSDHRTIAHLFIAPLPPMQELTLQEGSDMRLFSITKARKLKVIPGDHEAYDIIEKTLQEKKIIS